MKNSLLLFIAFCTGVVGANAQITINSSDIAAPGKIFYQAKDSLPTMSIGTAGADQVWNFSSSLNMTSVDTLTFMPLNNAPNQEDFPAANVVIPFGSQAQCNYAVNSSSELISVGNTEIVILYIGAYPTTIVKTDNPTEKLFNFPTNYNSTFTDSSSSFTEYFYGSIPSIHVSGGGTNSTRSCGLMDSLREITNVNKTVLVDAWGSLTTSLGTYNTLRIKETRLTHYTKDGHDASLLAWFNVSHYVDSTTTYTWWANGIGSPLLTAVMDSTGNVKTAKWLMAPSATTGINELTAASDVNVFPNPAQDVLNVVTKEASKQISVQVFDITGQMINSYPVSNDKAVINTSDYVNGIYTYSIIGKSNTILNRGKFTVAK